MRRVLFLSLGLLVLAALVAAVLLLRSRSGDQAANVNAAANANAVVATTPTDAAVAATQTDRQAALAAARLAVARVGSFSVATAATAADELAPLTTAAGLTAARDRTRQEAARLTLAGSNVVMVTETLAASVTRSDARSAIVRVEARRSESAAGAEPTTVTTTVDVSLVRPGEAWLVDRWTWL